MKPQRQLRFYVEVTLLSCLMAAALLSNLWNVLR